MADDDSIDGFIEYLTRPFALDLRSLAVLRIGFGVLLLADLVNRGLWLRAHYTDFGVLPREALLDTLWDSAWLSVHMYTGSFWPIVALFVLAGLFAVAMIVGYWTTLATAGSWFLLISLHARNPMVLQGGDITLRLLMFWAMFLPIGARWSVDAALDPGGEPTGTAANRHVSIATLAYIAQIAYMYLFAALLKTSDEWHTDFSAAYYALSIDQFTTPVGDWLWQQPEWVLQALTAATYGLEAYGWALLIAPLVTIPLIERSTAVFRLVAIVLFVGMHLGFAVSMRLGLFSFIASVAWIALLPGWFWECVAARCTGFGDGFAIHVEEPASQRRCETVARLARGLLLLPSAALDVDESDPDAGDGEASWRVVDPAGEIHRGADGWIALLNASPVFGPVFRLAERLVGLESRIRNRWASWCESTRLRTLLERGFSVREYRLRNTVVGATVCAFALMGAFWWNMQTIDDRFDMLQPWRRLAVSVRLDQKWNMFAPYPLKEDGWYVIPGTLRNGEQVSLFQAPHREPPDWEKPEDVSATYPNQRWRKYMMNIWLKKYNDQRVHYGRYLCRRWNSRHSGGERLSTFEIYFMEEVSQPDHQVPEPRKANLWSHDCFDAPDDDPSGTSNDAE